MDLLREVLSPDFLLRNSLYVGVLVGLACPLIGAHLILRRMIFLGVALPQVSSCGIACAFALHTWGIIPHFEQGEHGLAFAGSTVLTLLTLALLAILERRGRGTVEGRIGVAYVLAGAWSVLLLVKNPFGEHGMLERMRGEIIAVTGADLALTASAFAGVTVCLVLFRKELLLVAFDRELALSVGKKVSAWDALLFLLIGVTVSIAVLGVGPLVTFGFLLIPTLIGRKLARSMAQLAALGSAIGAGTAFCGFCIAYRFDLPVGPTDVALLGCVYGAVSLIRR